MVMVLSSSNMVRRCILCMMLGLATSVAALSQHLSGYELEREMPVFLDQLKAELTYPMAWGNSPVKNFKKWRKQARNAVLDAMLAPPPRTTDYRTEVVAEEQRNGYKARKLRFNLCIIIYIFKTCFNSFLSTIS